MEINVYKETDCVFYGSNSVIIRNRDKRVPFQQCFHYHWHERMELIRVHSGSIKVNFGEKELIVPKGSIIIIPPYRLHGGYAEGEGAVFQTVMFELSSFYNNTIATHSLLVPIEQRRVRFDYFSDNPTLIRAFDKLLTMKNHHEKYMPLLIASSIYEIIGLLYSYCLVSDDMSTISDKKLAPILEYIDKNFCNHITSSSICNRFGYSQGYFCRKFKESTGYSLSVYIRLLRLERAKEMLQNSDKSVGQIAQECGFPDFSYFCQCFKSTYHLSPTKFIKNKNTV